MFDCNNLKKAKSITVAPIKEFALVHGREKITEEKVLAEEKLKDLEALIYSTSANCHLAKEEEIKYFVDFLTHFCKGGLGI